MITVLGISGSMRYPSHTHTLLDIALAAARDSGARVELLDLRTLDLPIYTPGLSSMPPVVTEIRDMVNDAHAYIIGTPEYHGNLSGALKNLFDYLYPEVNGKLFGCVVATGNDVGTTSLVALREIIASLHAWVLPYGVIAALPDFDTAGHLTNNRIRDRLLRLGRDVTIYGNLLFERYARDSILGGGPNLGFAPWHARE